MGSGKRILFYFCGAAKEGALFAFRIIHRQWYFCIDASEVQRLLLTTGLLVKAKNLPSTTQSQKLPCKGCFSESNPYQNASQSSAVCLMGFFCGLGGALSMLHSNLCVLFML